MSHARVTVGVRGQGLPALADRLESVLLTPCAPLLPVGLNGQGMNPFIGKPP